MILIMRNKSGQLLPVAGGGSMRLSVLLNLGRVVSVVDHKDGTALQVQLIEGKICEVLRSTDDAPGGA